MDGLRFEVELVCISEINYEVILIYVSNPVDEPRVSE